MSSKRESASSVWASKSAEFNHMGKKYVKIWLEDTKNIWLMHFEYSANLIIILIILQRIDSLSNLQASPALISQNISASKWTHDLAVDNCASHTSLHNISSNSSHYEHIWQLMIIKKKKKL